MESWSNDVASNLLITLLKLAPKLNRKSFRNFTQFNKMATLTAITTLVQSFQLPSAPLRLAPT
jgi:hypothetical protein